MEKDNKNAGRHRALRLRKKQRATKLEMLYTFLQRHHPDVLAQFEQFYGSGTTPTSTKTLETPAEKPPSLEATEFRGEVNPSPESQDISPTTTTGDDVPGPEQPTYVWDNIWDDSLPGLSDVDFDLEAYLNAAN